VLNLRRDGTTVKNDNCVTVSQRSIVIILVNATVQSHVSQEIKVLLASQISWLRSIVFEHELPINAKALATLRTVIFESRAKVLIRSHGKNGEDRETGAVESVAVDT
jgi:hypothetical protein